MCGLDGEAEDGRGCRSRLYAPERRKISESQQKLLEFRSQPRTSGWGPGRGHGPVEELSRAGLWSSKGRPAAAGGLTQRHIKCRGKPQRRGLAGKPRDMDQGPPITETQSCGRRALSHRPQMFSGLLDRAALLKPRCAANCVVEIELLMLCPAVDLKRTSHQQPFILASAFCGIAAQLSSLPPFGSGDRSLSSLECPVPCIRFGLPGGKKSVGVLTVTLSFCLSPQFWAMTNMS